MCVLCLVMMETMLFVIVADPQRRSPMKYEIIRVMGCGACVCVCRISAYDGVLMSHECDVYNVENMISLTECTNRLTLWILCQI